MPLGNQIVDAVNALERENTELRNALAKAHALAKAVLELQVMGRIEEAEEIACNSPYARTRKAVLNGEVVPEVRPVMKHMGVCQRNAQRALMDMCFEGIIYRRGRVYYLAKQPNEPTPLV